MHAILVDLMWIAVLACIASLWGYMFYWGDKVTARLRQLHEPTWIELGRPIVGDRVSSKAKFIPYLNRRGYRALGDEELNRLGDVARALLYITVVAFAFLLVDAFAMFFVFPLGDH